MAVRVRAGVHGRRLPAVAAKERRRRLKQPLDLRRLREWAEEISIGDGTVGGALQDKQFSLEGRGLIATRDLKRGDRPLRIPRSAIIDRDMITRIAQDPSNPSCSACALFREIPDEFTALACFLLHERSRGADSMWSSYIETLPQDGGDTVLMWPQSFIDENLSCTEAYAQAMELREQCDLSIKFVSKLIENSLGISSEAYTPEDMRWALSICLSRVVRLPGLDDTLAIIPWADLLNHRSSVSSHIDYDQGLDAVTLTLDRDYKSGSQVFASYGIGRCSSEFLVSYGFVPVDSDAALDRVSISLDARDLQGENTKPPWMDGVFSEFGMQNSIGVFQLRLKEYESRIIQFARASLASNDKDCRRALQDPSVSLDAANDEAALSALVKYLSQRLDLFPRTATEEEKRAADFLSRAAGMDIDNEKARILRRAAYCSLLRMREIRILSATQSALLAAKKQATVPGGVFRALFQG